LKAFTTGLFAESYYLPLNIFSSNGLDLKSLYPKNPVISFLRNPPYVNSYYYEFDQIFNWSSKTDVFDLYDSNFVSNQDATTGRKN
jgi:hypothetical protein